MTEGYMGKMLRVDLGKGILSDEELDESALKTWVGGIGLGAKYLFEEVPAEVGWNHPDNKVILASGPLGGTSVSGSGTIGVVTKGALTGGAASTQANGFLGAYIKFCGYDGLIIQGASSEWVYLHVDDKGASLRSAKHLVGKDTWEIQHILRQELGIEQVSIYGIGPAGENLVRFAALVGDYGHVAAHNGVGAVLGSKRLKAIAVARGKHKISVKDSNGLREVSKSMADTTRQVGFNPLLVQFGTAESYPVWHGMGGLPVRNLTTNLFAECEKFTGHYLHSHFEVRPKTCWACSWAHNRWIKIKDGPYAGFEGEEPEYEQMSAMGSIIGQTDPAAAVVLGNLVDRLGMDVNEVGWVIAWVMECYEKGYFKKGDMDGLEMTWGNVEATRALIERIARREGIGNELAEGVKRAAEKTGGLALSCAVYTLKGNTPRGHDHRAVWTEFFDTNLSNTGTIESTGGFIRADQHGLKPISNGFDWEQVVNQNAKLNGRRIFEDSLGICRFPNDEIRQTVSCVNAATGWEFTLDDAMTVGKRIVNLFRVFNHRCGILAELDAPSERYGSIPVDGPAQGKAVRDIWDNARRRYYELMGWDSNTGYPLAATLEELGLSYLINK